VLAGGATKIQFGVYGYPCNITTRTVDTARKCELFTCEIGYYLSEDKTVCLARPLPDPSDLTFYDAIPIPWQVVAVFVLFLLVVGCCCACCISIPIIIACCACGLCAACWPRKRINNNELNANMLANDTQQPQAQYYQPPMQ